MKACLLCGGGGGVAPPMIYLAIGLVYHNDPMPSMSYWLGILIFFVMGAFLVWTFKENVTRKAFFLGLGLPALVSGAIGEATRLSETFPSVSTEISILDFVITPARAGDISPKWRDILIEASTDLSPYIVSFYFNDGSVAGMHVITEPEKPNSVNIPEGTAYYNVTNPYFDSPVEPLPENPKGADIDLQIKLKKESKPWSGFFRAVGFQNVKGTSKNDPFGMKLGV